jgi:transposase
LAKAQPVVYRWTNGAGWVKPTSYEMMKMKAVNHKPMIYPEGTLVLQGGEEVRYVKNIAFNFSLTSKFFWICCI